MSFYFFCVLTVLQHHRVTVNLRKSRFFPKRAEFVRVDVLPTGNAPAQAKNKAIQNLTRPVTFTDLRLLIGLLGFYRNWIPLYKTRIAPWRKILKKQPVTGTAKGVAPLVMEEYKLLERQIGFLILAFLIRNYLIKFKYKY